MAFGSIEMSGARLSGRDESPENTSTIGSSKSGCSTRSLGADGSVERPT